MALLIAGAALHAPLSAQAQTIRGRAIVEGTGEPVRAARVVLLDEALSELAREDTDAAGTFHFDRVRPGRYSLQAELDGMQTPLAAITLPDDGTTTVELAFPAAVVRLAFSCDPAATPQSRTILGTAYDPASGVVLPDVRMRFELGDGEWETRTDMRGQYRFCHIPAGEIATISAELLGRRTELQVRLPGNAIERIDLALEMNALSFSYEIEARRPLPEGSPSSLVLHVRDAADGRALGGVAIELEPDPRRLGTGRDGILRFDRLAPGDYQLVMEHIGYGRRTLPLRVEPNEEARVDVAVPPLPVRLDPIAVKSSALGSELRDRASPTRVGFVAGADMAFAQARAARVADVLRAYFPGIQVREGQYSTFENPLAEQIVCLESSRRLERLLTPPGIEQPFCDMMVVVVDGVRIFQPGHYLRGLSVDIIESLEVLNPLDAGIRYGTDASNTGALLLWTRGRGPHMSAARGRH
jgi:hypothetical protein